MRKLVLMLLIVLATQSVAIASEYVITSPFGWRIHPISGEWHFHNGVDIAAVTGTPIVAMYDGKVVAAGQYGGGYEGFGNLVIIDHGYGKYTLYAHCSEILVPLGSAVSQGQIIALVGSTGNSTGPHLHLSLIENGEYKNPLQ